MSESEELVTTTEAPKTLAVNPVTGQAIELDASDQALAGLFQEAKDMKSELSEFQAFLRDELLRRMDADASWTRRTGSYKIEGDSPAGVDYDPEKLYAALLPLVKNETISAAAAGEALQVKSEKVVRKKGINALLKLGGDVVAAVKSAEVPIDKQRAVRVKREG